MSMSSHNREYSGPVWRPLAKHFAEELVPFNVQTVSVHDLLPATLRYARAATPFAYPGLSRSFAPRVHCANPRETGTLSPSRPLDEVLDRPLVVGHDSELRVPCVIEPKRGIHCPPEPTSTTWDTAAMSASEPPPTKKRKLPSLDDSFSDNPRRTDSPALHQGRKRTQPHVDGQWAAHVYLDLELDPSLRKTFRNLLEAVKAVRARTDKGVHVSFSPDDASNSTLHVSLTRPLYVQTNQKADLRAAVARVATAFKGFSVRFASLGTLENDEKNRKFLAVEIGQGYQELKDIVRKLDAELETMRLPPYYDSPRFHASIAWTTIGPDSNVVDDDNVDNDTNDPTRHEDVIGPAQLDEFDSKFGPALRRDELWVDGVVIKIGKETNWYPLSLSST